MKEVQLSTGTWSARAMYARSFKERLLGNRQASPGAGLILETRSVHSFGQPESIEIVGLDQGMRVVAIRTLEPNRVVVLWSVAMIIELPSGAPAPALDDVVAITDE